MLSFLMPALASATTLSASADDIVLAYDTGVEAAYTLFTATCTGDVATLDYTDLDPLGRDDAADNMVWTLQGAGEFVFDDGTAPVSIASTSPSYNTQQGDAIEVEPTGHFGLSVFTIVYLETVDLGLGPFDKTHTLSWVILNQDC